MSRPNMGFIDDERYKTWQGAADRVERPWKIWAARVLDKAAKDEAKKDRCADG